METPKPLLLRCVLLVRRTTAKSVLCVLLTRNEDRDIVETCQFHCGMWDQKEQTPKGVRQLINGARQIIETVNSQLDEQFGIERNRAHTFLGLYTRLYSKLAAHTLCVYLNRLLGEPDFLHIKQLAFNN